MKQNEESTLYNDCTYNVKKHAHLEKNRNGSGNTHTKHSMVAYFCGMMSCGWRKIFSFYSKSLSII